MEVGSQPYYDKLASNLLFTGLVLNLGVMLFSNGGLSDNPFLKTATTIAGLVITIAFLAYQYYCIRNGKIWAKVVLVVFTLLGILLPLIRGKSIYSSNNTLLDNANNILGFAIQGIAIALVFRYKFNKGKEEQEKALNS